MEIFENQHQCSCQKEQDKQLLFQPSEAFMLGNLFQDLYQSYKGFSNYCFQPLNARQQMLLNVQINEFVAHEINLYLDNHPHDKRMIQLYHEYAKRAKQAQKNFEKQFGPLNVSNSNITKPFQWIEEPWPWQHQI